MKFAQGGVPKWKEPIFGGATLLKSGKLRDSVEILETTDNSVTVGTESKNRFHNIGYSYTPTRKQRAFFFWKLKEQGLYNKSQRRHGSKFIVPERRFLKFQQEDIDFISKKLSQYIVKD